MTEKTTCEIWLCINEDGSHEVATDESDAAQRLIDNFGGTQMRMVKLSVKVLPPAAAELVGEVPDEAGTIAELQSAG